MNRIFTILLAALTFFFGAEVANSVLLDLDGDANKVAYYLQENVYVLNYMDEEMGYDGDIDAIDYIKEVTVLNDQESYVAYLCEFSKEQGYMLLADDYVLLDYARNKTTPYKGINALEYIYSELTSAYLYKTIEGRVLSTNPLENAIEDYPSGAKNFLGISESASYVKSEYGSGYVRNIGLAISYKPIFKPSDLTIYQKNGVDAEENCVLTATFLALQAMKHNNKLPYFPSNTQTVFYDTWKNESEAYQIEVDLYKKKCKYNLGYIYNFPVLYKEIRNFSSKNFWKIENLTGAEGEKLMNHMGGVYNTPNLCAKYTDDWQDYVPEITKSLNKYGMPSLFKMYQDGSYHTMAVIGYTTFEKETKILFFTTKKTVTLLNVFNSNFESVYFDVSAYHGAGGAQIMWL